MSVKSEIRRILIRIQHRVLVKSGERALPGTRSWFIAREVRYGGRVSGVQRKRISEHEKRSSANFDFPSEIGGDRMSPKHHDYGRHYAEALPDFVAMQGEVVIVECGILKGSGLAIWTDLFPQGRVIGLDIDLSNFEQNHNYLLSRGAFKHNSPQVYEFDGFVENSEYLANILKGDLIDFFIDDASHTTTSIIATFRSVKDYLAEKFLYAIEDNDGVEPHFRKEFPEYSTFVCGRGQLTLVTPRES